eukprot:GHRQ01022760.1.p1 GENE.GHRQ01022760.1~~GHRQ01022760.1.p1  ORF type:complete len:256 (+),score=44.78 GHRQ01022760.1:52-768(+)
MYPANHTMIFNTPAAALVMLLQLWGWAAADAHRMLHQAAVPPFSASKAAQQIYSASPATDDWPTDWPEIPVQVMSRGELQAKGGAIKALGLEKLQRIKTRSSVNLTVKALAAKLDKDNELYVDVTGEQLLHKCELQSPSRAPARSAAAVLSNTGNVGNSAAKLTRAEAFSLSSRPGALKKIVLDFDGHTTTSSKWNVGGQLVITSPPWDTDGDPTSFTDTELAQLKAIWSIVAEGAVN